MEGSSENPQFDSLLGGCQIVPNTLNISDFIKHRMEEIAMLTEAIEESPFRGQAFQRLPKHMRRRQMSHYIKRLPRRLQRPYLTSLKEEPPAPTKRPSRKFRRRASNLLLEYNRRQKNSVWLETHIWHAKRYHMVTKWGYKLPERPVNKSFKACYRAISEHCLLIDKSYYNCIELKGPKNKLLDGLKQCTSPECGLTFGAKMFINGTREGCVTLFHPNSYPYQVIGNVTFIWEPVNNDRNESKIWIWVHPLTHNEIVECFKLLFDLSESVNLEQKDVLVDKKNSECEKVKLETKNIPFIKTPTFVNKTDSITMTLLKDTLNRFQLIGPLSQAIVSQAFTVASVRNFDEEVEILGVESKKRKIEKDKSEKSKNWWEKFCGNDSWFDEKKYIRMSKCCQPSYMPSGVVIGLVIEDPRLRIPAKREKAVPVIKNSTVMTEIDPTYCQSPIWIPEIRDEVSSTKLTTHEINEAKSKKIVPGFDATDVIPDDKKSKIPILLVQKPGRRDTHSGKLGMGSGWDIIIPAGFGMPIWHSLIFRGARTGGLRESELLNLECTNINDFLPPDSTAGGIENREKLHRLKTQYFKLPPNKRANFTKLGIVTPFYPPWEVLIQDWILKVKPDSVKTGKFCVLRNFKLLLELSEIVDKFTKKRFDYSKMNNYVNYLIPVVIECTGRGKPTDMALICLPENTDFKTPPPVEPSHHDENEKSRKILKLQHTKLLKSLKRKRKKDKAKLKEDFANNLPGKLKWKEILKSDSAPSEPHSKEYNEQMERLWLPPVESIKTVINSCSRSILGFVVKGEFSYSKARSLGLGFVTVPGLLEVFKICRSNKSKVVVLFRNRNQVQYRFGELKIACGM